MAMSEKEESQSAMNEMIGKPEEMGENLTNEDTPVSLEAIPCETASARNGGQAMSKDKAKSKRKKG